MNNNIQYIAYIFFYEPSDSQGVRKFDLVRS